MTGFQTARARLVWGLIAVVGVGAAGGFVIGRKWPIQTVEQLFQGKPSLDKREWKIFGEAGFPRYEPGRARVGDVLYVLGGFYTGGDPKATARVDAFDLRSRKWSRRNDMPTALTHFAPVVVRDTVWIAGGFVGDHPGPATSHVWRYVPSTDQWLRGPDLPAPRGGGAFVALGDTLHYFGGWLPDRNTDSHDHWTLRIGDSSWRSDTPFPFARGHLAGVAIAGRIYAVTGNIGHDPIPIDVRRVDVYDPVTHTWSEGPAAPFSTSHTEGATLAYDNGFVSIGGRSKLSGRDNQDDVLRFDARLGQWIHMGRFPIAALGVVATLLGDTIVGGLGAVNGNDPSNPWMWSTALRNRWHIADSMPIPLGEVAAGIIDHRLYVTGQGSAKTLVYDTRSGRWLAPDETAARPMPGDHQAAEVVEGKLYLFGGMGASAGIVQVYDPVTNAWSLGPAMPFKAGSSATALIHGRVYVAGGIVGHGTTADAAVFDPATGGWRAIASMPLPRNHAAAATDGERLCVFGGRGPGSGDDNEVANGYAEVQCYDPVTNAWNVSGRSASALSPLPQARGGTGKAVFLDGEYWIVGGETLDGAEANAEHTYARVDIYDPKANRWRRGPDLPTARHGIFPIIDNGQIYVAGGGTRAGFGASAVLEVIWPKAPFAR